MHIRYIRILHWPRLAWLAEVSKGQGVVRVFHGADVECRDGWWFEGAWDGRFEHGRFDCTDIVCGSGARLQGNAILFVSAGNTCERLAWANHGGGVRVSNSLACLLQASGDRLDPVYPRHYEDACSVILGIEKYKREISTFSGRVRTTYFHNLCWDGVTLSETPKPMAERHFDNFAMYREFLQQCLAGIMENAADPNRRRKYLPITTLSSGYDSTAVSALAQSFGVSDALTISEARHGGSDSGEDIGRQLGLSVRTYARHGWRSSPECVVRFLASYSSGEDVVFAGFGPALEGRLVLTGYHGDKIWDRNAPYVTPDIRRGDPSGLSLCEYRLHVGFVNAPIPFWGARSAASIVGISRSAEMADWDIGGNYTRPIPRRIAEQAGIARDAFGQRKKAVTVNPMAGADVRLFKLGVLPPEALADFLGWIRANRNRWRKAGRIPPIASPRLNALINRAHMTSVDAKTWIGSHTPLWRFLRNALYGPRYLNRHMMAWATDRCAVEDYGDVTFTAAAASSEFAEQADGASSACR